MNKLENTHGKVQTPKTIPKSIITEIPKQIAIIKFQYGIYIQYEYNFYSSLVHSELQKLI